MTEFKLAVVKLAAYYEKDLSDEQILMYADQLHRALSLAELSAAIRAYIDNPANEFFPRPISKLISLVKKPIENRDQSQNILALIKNAVRRHGDNWVDGYFYNYETVYRGQDCSYTSWENAALSVIGSAALKVVRKGGGWKAICDFFYSEPEGVFNAHIARLSEAVLNMADAGMVEHLPTLPEPTANILKLVSIKPFPPPKDSA